MKIFSVTGLKGCSDALIHRLHDARTVGWQPHDVHVGQVFFAEINAERVPREVVQGQQHLARLTPHPRVELEEPILENFRVDPSFLCGPPDHAGWQAAEIILDLFEGSRFQGSVDDKERCFLPRKGPTDLAATP